MIKLDILITILQMLCKIVEVVVGAAQKGSPDEL